MMKNLTEREKRDCGGWTFSVFTCLIAALIGSAAITIAIISLTPILCDRRITNLYSAAAYGKVVPLPETLYRLYEIHPLFQPSVLFDMQNISETTSSINNSENKVKSKVDANIEKPKTASADLRDKIPHIVILAHGNNGDWKSFFGVADTIFLAGTELYKLKALKNGRNLSKESETEDDSHNDTIIYALDFNKESAMIHSAIIERQAKFIHMSISHVLLLHKDPQTGRLPHLTLIGHSLGGVSVIRALTKDHSFPGILSNFGDESNDQNQRHSVCETRRQGCLTLDLRQLPALTIILLNTPISGHPFLNLNITFTKLYRQMYRDLLSQFHKPPEIPMVNGEFAAESNLKQHFGFINSKGKNKKTKSGASVLFPRFTFLYTATTGNDDEIVPSFVATLPSFLPRIPGNFFASTGQLKAYLRFLNEMKDLSSNIPGSYGNTASCKRLLEDVGETFWIYVPIHLDAASGVQESGCHNCILWKTPVLRFIQKMFMLQGELLDRLETKFVGSTGAKCEGNTFVIPRRNINWTDSIDPLNSHEDDKEIQNEVRIAVLPEDSNMRTRDRREVKLVENMLFSHEIVAEWMQTKLEPLLISNMKLMHPLTGVEKQDAHLLVLEKILEFPDRLHGVLEHPISRALFNDSESKIDSIRNNSSLIENERGQDAHDIIGTEGENLQKSKVFVKPEMEQSLIEDSRIRSGFGLKDKLNVAENVKGWLQHTLKSGNLVRRLMEVDSKGNRKYGDTANLIGSLPVSATDLVPLEDPIASALMKVVREQICECIMPNNTNIGWIECGPVWFQPLQSISSLRNLKDGCLSGDCPQNNEQKVINDDSKHLLMEHMENGRKNTWKSLMLVQPTALPSIYRETLYPLSNPLVCDIWKNYHGDETSGFLGAAYDNKLNDKMTNALESFLVNAAQRNSVKEMGFSLHNLASEDDNIEGKQNSDPNFELIPPVLFFVIAPRGDILSVVDGKSPQMAETCFGGRRDVGKVIHAIFKDFSCTKCSSNHLDSTSTDATENLTAPDIMESAIFSVRPQLVESSPLRACSYVFSKSAFLLSAGACRDSPCSSDEKSPPGIFLALWTRDLLKDLVKRRLVSRDLTTHANTAIDDRADYIESEDIESATGSSVPTGLESESLPLDFDGKREKSRDLEVTDVNMPTDSQHSLPSMTFKSKIMRALFKGSVLHFIGACVTPLSTRFMLKVDVSSNYPSHGHSGIPYGSKQWMYSIAASPTYFTLPVDSRYAAFLPYNISFRVISGAKSFPKTTNNICAGECGPSSFWAVAWGGQNTTSPQMRHIFVHRSRKRTVVGKAGESRKLSVSHFSLTAHDRLNPKKEPKETGIFAAVEAVALAEKDGQAFDEPSTWEEKLSNVSIGVNNPFLFAPRFLPLHSRLESEVPPVFWPSRYGGLTWGKSFVKEIPNCPFNKNWLWESVFNEQKNVCLEATFENQTNENKPNMELFAKEVREARRKLQLQLHTLGEFSRGNLMVAVLPEPNTFQMPEFIDQNEAPSGAFNDQAPQLVYYVEVSAFADLFSAIRMLVALNFPLILGLVSSCFATFLAFLFSMLALRLISRQRVLEGERLASDNILPGATTACASSSSSSARKRSTDVTDTSCVELRESSPMKLRNFERRGIRIKIQSAGSVVKATGKAIKVAVDAVVAKAFVHLASPNFFSDWTDILPFSLLVPKLNGLVVCTLLVSLGVFSVLLTFIRANEAIEDSIMNFIPRDPPVLFVYFVLVSTVLGTIFALRIILVALLLLEDLFLSLSMWIGNVTHLAQPKCLGGRFGFFSSRSFCRRSRNLQTGSAFSSVKSQIHLEEELKTKQENKNKAVELPVILTSSFHDNANYLSFDAEEDGREFDELVAFYSYNMCWKKTILAIFLLVIGSFFPSLLIILLLILLPLMLFMECRNFLNFGWSNNDQSDRNCIETRGGMPTPEDHRVRFSDDKIAVSDRRRIEDVSGITAVLLYAQPLLLLILLAAPVVLDVFRVFRLQVPTENLMPHQDGKSSLSQTSSALKLPFFVDAVLPNIGTLWHQWRAEIEADSYLFKGSNWPEAPRYYQSIYYAIFSRIDALPHPLLTFICLVPVCSFTASRVFRIIFFKAYKLSIKKTKCCPSNRNFNQWKELYIDEFIRYITHFSCRSKLEFLFIAVLQVIYASAACCVIGHNYMRLTPTLAVSVLFQVAGGPLFRFIGAIITFLRRCLSR